MTCSRYKNPFGNISERPSNRELATTRQAAYLGREFLNLSCSPPPSNIYQSRACSPFRSTILLSLRNQKAALGSRVQRSPCSLGHPHASRSLVLSFPKPPPSWGWEMDVQTAGECLLPSTPRDSEGVPWGLAPWNRSVRVLASKLCLPLVENVNGGQRKCRRDAQCRELRHFLPPFRVLLIHARSIQQTVSACGVGGARRLAKTLPPCC